MPDFLTQEAWTEAELRAMHVIFQFIDFSFFSILSMDTEMEAETWLCFINLQIKTE